MEAEQNSNETHNDAKVYETRNDKRNEDDTKLQVKSSKNNLEPIVKLKQFKAEKDLVTLYEYECENCNTKFHDKVDCCEYCGSKFLKEVDSGKKYCYLDSGSIKLTSNFVLPEYHKVTIVSIISLVILILLIVVVAFTLNMVIEHINFLYLSLLIFELLLVSYLSRLFSTIMDRIDDRNSHKTYLFIKGYDYCTNYDENNNDLSKKGLWSIVSVKHRLENGTELTLKSNLIVSSEDEKKKVDVLINMDDYSDYEIGFNLENKIKKLSKR